ncbi:MAG: hypothetical protein SFY32_03245 [Bacteroidota bacterium]|nr:hypothetical protein [Bacteroidota bacterium]
METTMILHGIKFIAFGILFISVAAYAVLRLWNWLVPELFKGPIIKFKHALGLMALSFILFGGFRGNGHRWHGGHLGQHQMYHQGCMENQKTNSKIN